MSDDFAPLKYLEVALADAQATVRAYDTKAQIVGIGYTFAINIVASVGGGFPKAEDSALMAVLIFWGIVMAPLFLFGYVLYPTRKTAPRVTGAQDAPLQQVLYVETARHTSVSGLVAAAQASDWVQEFSFEILKVSKLREMKRARFIRALFAAAFSFAVLSGVQVWQAL